MDIVGELIDSSLIRTEPKRRAMAARRAIEAVQHAQVPWLLALLPVGSLLVAGLLVMLLTYLVPMSPAAREPDVVHAERVDPTAPSVDSAGDEWIVDIRSVHTR